MLCLHGFPDIPRTWSKLAPELVAAGYQVVCPWLPGYAPSSLIGPFDALTVTQSVLQLAEELSHGRPVRIVGHDWGAVVTQLAAALRPDLLRAAAMLAIPHLLAIESNLERHPKQLRHSAYIGLFALPVISGPVVRFGDYRFVERLWRAWSPGFDPGADYLDEVKTCLRSSRLTPLRYYRSLSSPKQLRELRAVLSKGPIVVPTLYLHGERDGCMVPDMARGQEKYFSALFESVTLTEAGHFLHLERPTEANAAILKWLQTH